MGTFYALWQGRMVRVRINGSEPEDATTLYTIEYTDEAGRSVLAKVHWDEIEDLPLVAEAIPVPV